MSHDREGWKSVRGQGFLSLRHYRNSDLKMSMRDRDGWVYLSDVMDFMFPGQIGGEIQLDGFKYWSSVRKSGWTYRVRADYLYMTVIIILFKISQGKCM